MVLELSSSKEKLCSLEKISWNGSLQIGKDYWEPRNRDKSHSTFTRWGQRGVKEVLKEREEIVITKNDTQYKEIDNTKFFANGDSNEFDAAISELIENNKAQVKEIRNLKIEQE